MDITDEIVDRVEDELGSCRGAWDMVDPKDIIRAVLKVVGLEVSARNVRDENDSHVKTMTAAANQLADALVKANYHLSGQINDDIYNNADFGDAVNTATAIIAARETG